MKVLLDENLPHALRHEIAGHEVFTVQFMGWSGVQNGVLLAKAVGNGFQAFVTMDNGVPYQQNMAVLELCVIVISAASNDMSDLRPLVPALTHALDNPGQRKVITIA